LPRARVFNGGRSGSSVAYTVGLADAYLRMFDPDWVVVLVRNEWDALLFDRSEEFFYEPSPGGFELRRSWHWLTMSPLRRKLVDWKLRDVALIHFGTQHLMSLFQKSISTEPDERPTVEQALRLRAIDWTVAELHARYPRLVLVHVPYATPQRGGLVPKTAAEARVAAASLREGVPLIAMRERIERDVQASGVPAIGFWNTLPWTGHANAHGHDLIARALAELLKNRLKR